MGGGRTRLANRRGAVAQINDAPPSDEPDFEQMAFEAGRVFTPSAPVAESTLFAGRTSQLQAMIDAINQSGQHAVLYGERGVGKTSLANVLHRFLSGHPAVMAPRVNCSSGDTYSDLWRRMLGEIEIKYSEPRIGFSGGSNKVAKSLGANLPDKVTLDHVRPMMARLGRSATVVLIFDEFDTVRSDVTRRVMAETIKTFSDFDVPTTIILVGVADSVAGLLKEHRSLERAIIQVQMPRMSDAELRMIIEKGLKSLGLSIEERAIVRITELSRGLPHYTHSLALHSTRAALEVRETQVLSDHVDQAIEVALKNAQQTIVESYNQAVYSVRKHHLYREVLLACALAPSDSLGWFSAAALREPLNQIVPGKNYDVPAFVRHLNDFSADVRGNILQKSGASHKFRFRFNNPMMQPYVVLRGYAEKMITPLVASSGRQKSKSRANATHARD